MRRRPSSLLVTACLVPATVGALLLPREVPAQRPPASLRRPEPPVPAMASAPPVSEPAQAVESTFLRREDPEGDLARLQQRGAKGLQLVATVDVGGGTRRYVLMRPQR